MKIKSMITFALILSSFAGVLGQGQKMSVSTEIFTETTPFISFDGNCLVYSSNISGAFEIYISYKSGAADWSEPQKIEFAGGALGAGMEIQDPCLNAMADILYFSAQGEPTQGGKDIYYSILKDGKWQQPQNIKALNSMHDETAPMISADNNYFFFVRKHVGENEDEFIHKIYYSKKNEARQWTEPVMVSEKINSSDENYPFFCEDNRMLYYASKRDKEPEGYNLYMTTMIAENVWFQPEPLTALNSDFDDIRPSKAANNSELYYAQFLQKRKSSEGDVYKATLPANMRPKPVFEFKGKVSDQQTQKALESTIIIRYTDNMEKVGEEKTKMPEGNYHFYYSQGRTLEFEVFAPNYSHSFFEYDAGFNTKIPESALETNFELFNESVLLLNVFDEEIFEPLTGKIEIFKEDSDVSENSITYKGNGRYELKLDIGSTYSLNISVANYEPYHFDFDLSGVVQYNEFEKDIELAPSKTPFEINIADMDTEEAMEEVEIVITNLEKNETIIKRVRKDENGKFIVDLRDGDKYEINVNGPKGYAFYNTKVDMGSTDNKKLDVKLKPLKAKTKLVLNDITFETNSAELNSSSFEEIDRVVKLLIDNPDINIEISAHTDNVGSNEYNEKLSHKRAQSVVEYLVSKSLPMERLIAKGYGETAPIASNDTEENRAKNRRVELKIVDVNETSESHE